MEKAQSSAPTPHSLLPTPRSEATIAFVTVGDTRRLTGGYLYHARVFSGLHEEGIAVEQFVVSGASPAEQEEAALRLGSCDFRRFDVIVVDALARIVCAPYLDRWREVCPLVAMVHELPSIVVGHEAAEERKFEEPLLRADLLIAVSEHGKSVLERRGVPAGRIRVVPPGFDRLPLEASVKHIHKDAPVRVLCVAQWIPRKGIRELVEAWTARDRPGATLELIGETGVDPGYADAVVGALRGDSSVRVWGPVDDAALARAYAAADLFVLPSWYEGYGIVYAEALAHGLPIIACDVGPIPELVGKEAALLVPPDDVDALSEALDLLLGDSGLRERMSIAAWRRVDLLPRWEDAVAGLGRVLREVVAERRAGRAV